jgi:transposase
MTKQVTKKKSTRISYTPEYRAEALGLADRVGVAEAARQLGIEGGLIYNWRKVHEAKASTSQAELALTTENARLKRQLAEQAEERAILKKAAEYFAKHQK